MTQSGQGVSYAELDARSNQGAQLFRSMGLSPGDAIALYVENCPDFFEIEPATAKQRTFSGNGKAWRRCTCPAKRS